MDYGSYRDPRMSRMPSSMGMPVTTITTGIPLSKRFAILEQTKAAYASEGYGMQRQSPAVQQGHVGGASSLMNRRLALALARNSRAALASPAAQRFRVPVQARLGLSRGRGRGGRGGPQGGRGGGLRQIQRSPGGIGRRGSPMRPRGTGNVKVLAVRGRGAGVAMRASGRGRGVVTGGRGGGGTRGRGGARGRGAGRGAARGKEAKPVDKDELDNELDSYMAKTRGYLDKQLDEYMAQAKASQEALAAGAVPAVDASDVTMAE